MEKILLLAALLFPGLMPQAAKKTILLYNTTMQCAITNISFDDVGPCDSDGSSDPDDDFYTVDVIVEFLNPPTSGELQIELGDDALPGAGPLSVDVPDLDSPDMHVFEGVRFKANGDPTEVTVFFSAQPTCTAVNFDGPIVQPCSTPPPPPCQITVNFSGGPGACDDNGTPNDLSDDFFTHNVSASFFNRPFTGSLQIVPGGDVIGSYSILTTSIVGNAHIFNNVKFKADGTPTVVTMNFTDAPGCSDTETGPTVQPCSTPPPPCTITVNFFGNPGPCDDNGTPNDPSDDFFTHNVGASFFNRPFTGSLQIVPGGDVIGAYSILATSIVGNSHIFNNVKFKADGTPTVVTMNFTDDPSCSDTKTGPTIGSCCNLSITNVATSSGNCPGTNNGSITVTAIPSVGPLTYSISGPVNQSNNTGIFTSLPDGNYTITVTDNGASNCVKNTSALVAAGVDNTPPTPVCRNTTVTLDATGNYTLTAADVFNQGASSDNCGTVNFVNVSPAAVGCAQVGQTIPATVQINDGNGNNATCTAQITVQEGTALPPGFSGANVGTANGNSIFQPCSGQKFTLSATGFSTPTSDVQHLVSRQLCGNGEIIAHVVSANGGGWAGITLRETTATGSKKVALKTQLTNNIHREIRTATNGPVNNLNFFRPQDIWLRLVRSGNNFSGYTSQDGSNWNFAFSTTISMANCIRAGLFAESINVNAITTAVFDHVSVSGAMALAAPTAGSPVAIEEAASADFQVYPNPASGEITLDLSAFANRVVQLEVCDANGKTVKTAEFNLVNTTDERLDLSSLNNGIYFIRIKSVGLPDVAKRVILQRD
ncbi:MAG: T9SS type A sorting domain-containing protein [Saprospiraceae bacterium]|nr:T9SS type A sorting domain-containing protein [Saprospiraceae bacterium]